jgi:hypothetical protein
VVKIATTIGNLKKKSKEDIPYHFKKGMVCQFEDGLVCPLATSEAGARPLEGHLSLQINI